MLAVTAAHRVLSNLIPINIQAKQECAYVKYVEYVKQKTNTLTIHHTDYMKMINIWQKHLAESIEPRIEYDAKDTNYMY